MPRFLFGLLSQAIVLILISFLFPILSLHLEEKGYGNFAIGLSFGIPTMIYAVTSKFVYVQTRYFKKQAVILFGYFTIFVGLLFVGPSILMGKDASPRWTFVGLSILGFGCA